MIKLKIIFILFFVGLIFPGCSFKSEKTIDGNCGSGLRTRTFISGNATQLDTTNCSSSKEYLFQAAVALVQDAALVAGKLSTEDSRVTVRFDDQQDGDNKVVKTDISFCVTNLKDEAKGFCLQTTNVPSETLVVSMQRLKPELEQKFREIGKAFATQTSANQSK